MATRPTYEQAQLHLQLYDLRREDRLRQARDWFFKNFFANTLDEALRVAPMASEEGTFFMMVLSYWDQACALLDYGLLHEDLFFETNGEFYGVWDRVKASIPEGRKRFSNQDFMAHLEKVAHRYEAWIEGRSPGALTAMRQFSQQMREQQERAA
jgi:hypothetical protein